MRAMRRLITLSLCAFLQLTVANGSARSAPQVCYDGYALLGEDDKAAVDALTQCIETGDLSNAASATAHYQRGLARWQLFWATTPKNDDLLGAARKDADSALEAQPLYADAFCLRGKIDLELSLGMNGSTDLQAGRALGGTSAVCAQD